MVGDRIPSSAIEDCLRGLLSKEGFDLSPKRSNGETGVDIKATRGSDSYFIEVIGYKSSAPMRAKDFFEAFFRAVSRLNDGAEHCVIAWSNRGARGLPARARQHREAWTRISRVFPELEIWLVDTENRRYERTKWGKWLERQVGDRGPPQPLHQP